MRFSTDEYTSEEIEKNGNGVYGGKRHDEICDYLQTTYRFSEEQINDISMGVWLGIEAEKAVRELRNKSLEQAIQLCRKLYQELSPDYYPALTGGTLYKDGARKDIDIVIYRNKDGATFEFDEIEDKLKNVGLTDFKHYGYVTKCRYGGLSVDLMNPETDVDIDYGDF